MHIAIVRRHCSLKKGGAERYCVNLFRGLQRLGHRVTIVGEAILRRLHLRREVGHALHRAHLADHQRSHRHANHEREQQDGEAVVRNEPMNERDHAREEARKAGCPALLDRLVEVGSEGVEARGLLRA